VARLHHDKNGGWLINGESLKGWLEAQDRLQHDLGHACYKSWPEFHRRYDLWYRLSYGTDQKWEEKSISAVAWFLPEGLARDKAARDGSVTLVPINMPSGYLHVTCLLRVFHRQKTKPEQDQPLYSVKHAEHGGKHFLSFCWDNAKCTEIKLPSRRRLSLGESFFRIPVPSLASPN